MDKIKQRALTYSLLAQIRIRNDFLAGPVDVFVPLVKRVISKMNEEGIHEGKSIYEIKEKADDIYGIDFPIPVLRTILKQIADEVNDEKVMRFFLYQDDAFQINNYIFTEFEDSISRYKYEIDEIEKLFQSFCQSCENNENRNTSILEFIERNKYSLSKYLSGKNSDRGNDFTIEAQFVDYFRNIPSIYQRIQNIYLGSIISSYLEYKTDNIEVNVELLFDTNFILGLLDLNTPESTDTCRKIIEITTKQQYVLKVMMDTLNEAKALLRAKADNFNSSYLHRKVYPEDIYNACERRKLNSVDLERIADNIEKDLLKFGIHIIHDVSKIRNVARFSPVFKALVPFRNNEIAALHDATAIEYVRKKRGRKIKEFENVNCWFVNNSINRGKYDGEWLNSDKKGFQPEIIKADDLLNIIWLSNPEINSKLDPVELTEIGLTSLISLSLTDSLPKASIIRELDDNIHKYSKDGAISDVDVVRVATRITSKQLINIEELNKMANSDKEEFVKRINQEAKKQQEIDEQRKNSIHDAIQRLELRSSKLEELTSEFREKSKKYDVELANEKSKVSSKDEEIENLKEQLRKNEEEIRRNENEKRQQKMHEFIDNKIKKWRRNSWIALSIFILLMMMGLISLLWIASWQFSLAGEYLGSLKRNALISALFSLVATIFATFVLKSLYSKYYDHSNIEAFKKSIKVPEEYQIIKFENPE